jgi:hypothetical protein
MRKADPKSVASRVAARIGSGPTGRLWTYDDFLDLAAPMTAVAAALSRLTRKGELRRIRRGIYYKPETTRFGESHPDSHAALEATLRRHGTPATPSGLNAWRRLGLTTQISSEASLISAKRLRISPVMGQRVTAVTRTNVGRSIENERAVLDALRAIRRIPGTTPGGVLDWARHHLTLGGLNVANLARMAKNEPPRVRALLGALMEDIDPDGTEGIREGLKRSLNPLTTFKFPGVRERLRSADGWNIR